tara:strand:- start:3914 stop:4558 length:645 start_codon:yes stop_codon:yes gene_type:complete
MALSTRQDLESAIADWLNREDRTVLDRIPDFITLAEKRIFHNPRMKCRSNEAYISYPDIGALGFVVPVPPDLRAVKIMTIGQGPLNARTDQAYMARATSKGLTGVCTNYTRLKRATEEYHLWPTQDGLTNAVELFYYQTQALGSQPINTTQVLTDGPGLYLFGALLEAAPFLKFPNDVPMWAEKFGSAFSDLVGDTHENELAGSTNDVSSVYGD